MVIEMEIMTVRCHESLSKKKKALREELVLRGGETYGKKKPAAYNDGLCS